MKPARSQRVFPQAFQIRTVKNARKRKRYIACCLGSASGFLLIFRIEGTNWNSNTLFGREQRAHPFALCPEGTATFGLTECVMLLTNGLQEVGSKGLSGRCPLHARIGEGRGLKRCQNCRNKHTKEAPRLT